MTQIRWIRISIAAAIGLAILAIASYWYAQQNSLNDVNDVNIDLRVPSCIVKFAPDDSSETIPFGNASCPQ